MAACGRPFLVVGTLFAVGRRLIQIEIANRLACIRGVFGLAQGLLKFFLQNIGSVFLSLNRLAEYGVPSTILLLHRSRGLVEIIEHLRFDGSHMRDDGLSLGVKLQHCPTTWAGDIEAVLLCHSLNDKPSGGKFGASSSEEGYLDQASDTLAVCT